jgi:hypothetical protein
LKVLSSDRGWHEYTPWFEKELVGLSCRAREESKWKTWHRHFLGSTLDQMKQEHARANREDLPKVQYCDSPGIDSRRYTFLYRI